MSQPAPRKSYLVVVLVILAVLVVVIAKTTTKQKTGAQPESQSAQLPAENPVARTAAAVPADSTKVGAPDPAPESPSPDTPVSSEPAPASTPPAAQPEPEPPAEPAAATAATEEPPAPQEEEKKEADLLPHSKLSECLKNGRPTLVDFGAGWCNPCKKQDPILRRTAAKYGGKVDVVFVDTDQYPEIAKQYRISAIPAQFVFDAQGKEVTKHIGLWPADQIDAALATAGVEK